MVEEYQVHDNGGRPFLVRIDGNRVSIHKNCTKFITYREDNVFEETPIKVYDTNRVFVGKSPKNEWTKFSGGYGPRFDGNTILLELSHCSLTCQRTPTYVIVGWKIESFKPQSKIIKYVSMVGNNDVPYAFAVDEKGYVYLLSDGHLMINPTKMPRSLRKMANDNPYEILYDAMRISSEDDLNHKTKQLLKMTFDINGSRSKIVQFFVGRKSRVLYYNPTPKNTCKRWAIKNIRIYVTTAWNRPKQEISYDNYIQIMSEYKKVIGFKHFEINLIHDRL